MESTCQTTQVRSLSLCVQCCDSPSPVSSYKHRTKLGYQSPGSSGVLQPCHDSARGMSGRGCFLVQQRVKALVCSMQVDEAEGADGDPSVLRALDPAHVRARVLLASP